MQACRKGLVMVRPSKFGLDPSNLTWRLWLVIGCSFIALFLLLARPWGYSGPSFTSKGVAVELPTRWAKEVTAEHVWSEYPRPQLRRQQWGNLNGYWEIQEVMREDEDPPFGQTLRERVLVPFPMESDLSGVGRYMSRSWYRTLFPIPRHWEGTRIMLNFGAVDWQCQAYLNGKELGVHTGGYDKFSFDITDYLKDGKDNELIVGVYDPTDHADGVPIGKQRSPSAGSKDILVGNTNILYTSSTGIWQTVWLEPVPTAHVVRADFLPDVDKSTVSVLVSGSPSANGIPLQITISEDLHGEEVASVMGKVGEKTIISIPKPKLWSPDSPHLYQVAVQMVEEHASGVLDQVSAYFGMRKIEVAPDAKGAPRIKLNGKVELNIGMLDQGFWPDGLYTAPCDDALVYDIQASKEMGFNVLRKHIKVEPDRWYYHADRLGMMVWQDMPSMCGMMPDSWGRDWYKQCMTSERDIPETGRRQFELEMARHIEEHISFPSIVMYVIFNEGWGQYETERVTKMAMQLDPSRIYNGASGWNDAAVGHVIDIHDYTGVNPAKPSGNRASVLGEYGGLGLTIPKHTFMHGSNASSYIMYNTSRDLNSVYLKYLKDAEKMMLDPAFSLSAIIYTELTDVEHEVNGWLTYDREVMKADATALRKAHRALIETSRTL